MTELENMLETYIGDFPKQERKSKVGEYLTVMDDYSPAMEIFLKAALAKEDELSPMEQKLVRGYTIWDATRASLGDDPEDKLLKSLMSEPEEVHYSRTGTKNGFKMDYYVHLEKPLNSYIKITEDDVAFEQINIKYQGKKLVSIYYFQNETTDVHIHNDHPGLGRIKELHEKAASDSDVFNGITALIDG